MAEQNVAIVRAILGSGGMTSNREILQALPKAISAPFHPARAWIEVPERVVYDEAAGGPALT